MKTIIRLLFIAAVMAIALPAKSQEADKNLKTVKFVTSMTCDHCVNTIMSSLPKEKGVKDVKCDLKTKEVTISYNKDKTSPELLQRDLEKLGYTAKEVKETPPAAKKN